MGVTTIVKNGNVDGALRIFKQKGIKSGDQKKLKERYIGYEKRGVKKRKAREEAIKNSRKNNRNNSYRTNNNRNYRRGN
jgi:ribosomal protein S21